MALVQCNYNKNDEWYTPRYAVYPIIKYLKPGATIWCPFDKEDSNFVRVLTERGFKVLYGHIETGQDFFTVDVPVCDYIVSNPPYSLKGEVMDRLFKIGKPFAMLVNMSGIFDAKARFELFKNNRVEVLWLSPRVNYINPITHTQKSVPFQSGYVCSHVLEDMMRFEYVDKEEEE